MSVEGEFKIVASRRRRKNGSIDQISHIIRTSNEEVIIENMTTTVAKELCWKLNHGEYDLDNVSYLNI
ncbi:hypothetical protein CL634_08370 [bacterium]|nr:hypothetical protein [bacterium]|tara:strand:- start:477 stop:680 length:204 start_codon:yes stop_codon:yes gene_type:complete